jgi:hypothetical protein
MTQEEKAKRYDELLLKLQKAKVDDNVCDEMYYRVIDDIVPELKESEDEKIRKRIIHALHGDVLDMEETNKAIAWLEKQGEQKSVKWTEEDEMHIRELESLVKQVWAIAEHENDKETIHKMSDLSFFLKTLKPQLKQ